MSLRRNITVAVILTLCGSMAWFGYSVMHTLRHLPEAYAAWDTGTLLVTYMESNDDRWPASWDDLLAVMSSEPNRQIMFRGASADDAAYAQSLREKVAIDWNFEPAKRAPASPVTRPDGTRFPMQWSGANPNEMIHAHLAKSRSPSATNAPP